MDGNPGAADRWDGSYTWTSHACRRETLAADKDADASAHRERQRQRRLLKLGIVIAIPMTWFWIRELSGNPVRPGMPAIIRDSPELALLVVLMAVMMSLMLIPYIGAGRSPHTVLRPEDSKVRLDDVVGASATKREAIDTLNIFLNHETFLDEMGGSARRGVLFEGPPGTGKTYLAKALAAEAGVPFLFVSASEFQSMFYGQTNRKIRTYFKALRKAARSEGGAIGFIEEFDAIGGARSGMGGGSSREGGAGIVNELLVQMQSFELPTGWQKVQELVHRSPQPPAARHRAMPRPPLQPRERARSSPPPTAPPTSTRRCCAPAASTAPSTSTCRRAPTASRSPSYYLGQEAPRAARSPPRTSPTSPPATPPCASSGCSTRRSIVALRDGRTAMTHHDVVAAQLVTEVGVSHDVGYHPDERRRVAVHEAGHALVAALTGRDVKLASHPAPLGFARPRRPRRGRGALPEDAHRGHRPDGRRARRARRRDPGVRRGLQRHRQRPRRRHHHRRAAGRACSAPAAACSASRPRSCPAPATWSPRCSHDEKSRAKADELMHRAADRAACTVLEHRRALIALADALCDQDELSGDEVHAIVAGAMAS